MKDTFSACHFGDVHIYKHVAVYIYIYIRRYNVSSLYSLHNVVYTGYIIEYVAHNI